MASTLRRRSVKLLASLLGALTMIFPFAETASATTPDENFVVRFYEDFRFREPTPSELSYWTTYLTSNSRADMANSLVQDSEFAELWVLGMHIRYLGYFDSADPAVVAQISALQSTHNFLQTEIDVIASTDYYNDSGGTDSTYVKRVIQDVWLRDPTPAEQTWYVSQVPSWGRGGIAFMVLVNAEASQVRIAGESGQVACPYIAISELAALKSGSVCLMLDRPAGPNDVSTWRPWLSANGYHMPRLWAAFAATTEYYDGAQL